MADPLKRITSRREFRGLSFFVVRRALPRVMWLARSVTPAMNHVFVTGFPSTEGNAVETARALHTAYPGKIVWAQAPSRDYLDAIGIPDDDRFCFVRKGSLRALWNYATAQAVFFTHGLYGEPPTSRRKPIINLWHGAGPKPTNSVFFAQRRMRAPATSYVVGGTRLWGNYCASVSSLTDDQVLLSGYPRFDQMNTPCAPDRLSSLGLDPAKPFVFWMPSYRTSKTLGTMPSHSDSSAGELDRDLARQMTRGIRILADHGVQTIVKPHPADAVSRRAEGAVFVDDDLLERHRIPLYSLLGAASGLITDISSVMTDFLKLDRPIAFFFPDRDAYRTGRGVYPPDVLDWLPGPFLDDADDFSDFARDVDSGGELSADQRRAAMDRAGILDFPSSARMMLELLKQKDSSAFADSLRLSQREAGAQNVTGGVRNTR